MIESLYLSHLAPGFLTKLSLEPLSTRLAPPTASEIAEAIISGGTAAREAWDAVDAATRAAEQTFRLMERSPVRFVDRWSEHFPRRLLSLDEPLWGLYFKGSLPEDRITLAVVGTRMPDRYGAEVLSRILGNFKSLAIQHVSGLAYGIDSLAHEHTLKRGITNFAVLAGGVDRIYPCEHERLAEEIVAKGGGILSEFPPGSPSEAWRFPRRNRIIAALADVVWIPRAARKSGSYHTALKASTYNKVLATTPGDAFAELSGLPHMLLRADTHLVTDSSDLDAILSVCCAG